jgi:phospholipase C
LAPTAREAIEHVVVLMLENRSFDHMLGWPEVDGRTVPVDPGNPTAGTAPVFELTGANAYRTTPDPPHEFADVTVQMFGQSTPGPGVAPANDGFVLSYSRARDEHGREIGSDRGKSILGCLSASVLPVLRMLAREFVVCDRWFAFGTRSHLAYDSLRGNEAVWQRSLLVIVYDEHGGFYDREPPPATINPDGRVSTSPAFGFDRLGVRVPALLVSPWVGRGLVDHTVYDHTSILAFLRRHFGLPAPLHRRDAVADSFERNFLDASRDDAPTSLTGLTANGPLPIVEANPVELSAAVGLSAAPGGAGARARVSEDAT